MLPFAWRNLLYDRTRLMISSGGVALAVLLIFFMGGVFAGSEEHAVVYMKNQPAELWLMQDGVQNLHMSTSLLPPQVVERARQIDGVRHAVGLLYASAAVDLGSEQVYSYIFAVEEGAPFGQPWKMAVGSPELIATSRNANSVASSPRTSVAMASLTSSGQSRERSPITCGSLVAGVAAVPSMPSR